MIITVAWFAAASLRAQGRISWRDHVRLHGDTNILVELCGPITGLKEIVEFTQLTVEGTITVAEGKLTAKEDEVYTEYEIDVIRVFRAPKAARRSTPGPINPSPFVTDALSTRPNATAVRLRRPYHGRVILDGGVLGVTSGAPTLEVGQHIIVSAYFDETRGWWVPHGTFEVRADGYCTLIMTSRRRITIPWRNSPLRSQTRHERFIQARDELAQSLMRSHAQALTSSPVHSLPALLRWKDRAARAARTFLPSASVQFIRRVRQS